MQFMGDYRALISGRVGQSNVRRPRGWALVGYVAGKVIFLAWVLFIPLLVYPWWVVLAAIVGVSCVTGVVVALTFQLAHCVEEATFTTPEELAEERRIWAVHEVESTVDFCPRNRFLTWFLGGLNYQIEHHLFPRVPHVHYPHIASIVRRKAAEPRHPLHGPRFPRSRRRLARPAPAPDGPGRPAGRDGDGLGTRYAARAMTLAAVCHAYGEPLSIEEVVLDSPQRDEVRVRVRACAVCHSDVAALNGAWGGDVPVVLGHEAAGVVEEVGPGVDGVRPGDRVVVSLVRHCGHVRPLPSRRADPVHRNLPARRGRARSASPTAGARGRASAAARSRRRSSSTPRRSSPCPRASGSPPRRSSRARS